jgi:hypothetical protein
MTSDFLSGSQIFRNDASKIVWVLSDLSYTDIVIKSNEIYFTSKNILKLFENYSEIVCTIYLGFQAVLFVTAGVAGALRSVCPSVASTSAPTHQANINGLLPSTTLSYVAELVPFYYLRDALI